MRKMHKDERCETSQVEAINYLMLNGSFIKDLGLVSGKTGLAILFFTLARRRDNRYYSSYANELIDEIYQELTPEVSTGLSSGLIGIGLGFQYLISNRYVDAHEDNVLSEFDDTIYSRLEESRFSQSQLVIESGIYFAQRVSSFRTRQDLKLVDLNQRRLHTIIRHLLDKDLSFKDLPFLLTLFSRMNDLRDFESLMETVLSTLEKLPYEQTGKTQLLIVFLLSRIRGQEMCRENIVIQHKIDFLLNTLDHNTMRSEESSNPIFITKQGLTWIYYQLFSELKEEILLKESKYWFDRSYKSLSDIKNKNSELGLMNGLAGSILVIEHLGCFFYDD